MKSILFGIAGLAGFIWQWLGDVAEIPRWVFVGMVAGLIVGLALYGKSAWGFLALVCVVVALIIVAWRT